MKLILNRHTTPIFILLMLVPMSLLGGCGWMSEPDYGFAADPDQDYSVSIQLISGNVVSSRAVDEYGSEAENYIDTTNLKILIFDENKRLKQVVFDNGKMDANTSLQQISSGFYVVRTKLDASKYDNNSKFAIVALANWENNDDKLSTEWNGGNLSSSADNALTIDDLAQQTFRLNPYVESNQTNSWMPGSDSGWIPMFGSRYASLAGYDKSIFNENNPMPVPDILMVRAISKIEIVNLDIAEDSPKIDGIYLAKRNQKGRLMQNYSFEGFTDNVTGTSLPADTEYTNEILPFYQEGNKYTIYMPEMEFYSSETRQAIRVDISMNGEKNYKWIYLAPYDKNGKPLLQTNYDSDWQSIKRNYIYQYTINSLAFEFVVSVDKWQLGGKVHIQLE